jgi:cytoskeletal protein CcmA (bactofilin family)
VFSATIPGEIDLARCRISRTLEFRRCTFQGEINLQLAETRGIGILESSIEKGIRADGLIVHGPLFLGEIQSEGEIRLPGAVIAGDLACTRASLKAQRDALSADRARIGGSVFLNDGFESEGAIRLGGAEIAGDLVCYGAKLKAGGIALFADSAKVGGSVFLKQGFESEGEIRLSGAEINGNLECDGAKFKANRDALSTDSVKIGGGIFMRPESGRPFESRGTIRLLNAEIKGNIECDGARFKAKDVALFADGVKTGGNLFLRAGFESVGVARLLNAVIAGDLDCAGAKLKARGNSLVGDGIKIAGAAFLCDGFEAEGPVRILDAIVGGDLTIIYAKVAAVNCQNTVVNGDLFWQAIENPADVTLDLSRAKVKNFCDDRESWPAKGKLLLAGFVYGEVTLYRRPKHARAGKPRLTEDLDLRAEDRVEWLMRQPVPNLTKAQPWMLLSKHLEGKGDHRGAKHVVFEYSRQLAYAKREWWRLRRLAIAFAWLEEAPLRIGYSIAFTVLTGWLIFGIAGCNRLLAPTDPAADKAFRANADLPAGYPELNTLAYTFENAVPLVKLGQDEKWAPDRTWFPKESPAGYWLLVCTRWALILSGWFQGAVLGAALLGRFKE